MIQVKNSGIIFEKLFQSPVIIDIMEKNPSLTEEKIKELYKKQWKVIGNFVREKKGFNIDIAGLGYFIYNYFPIPLYSFYKNAWIQMALSKKPWPPDKEERYDRSIRTLIENINRNNVILRELYDKHPQYKEKFQVYWTRALTKNNQGFFKQTLGYLRRFLEEFDVHVSDEVYERTYQNAKEDMRFMFQPKVSDSV